MRNLLVLGVVMGMVFHDGAAKADGQPDNQAAQTEATNDSAGPEQAPSSRESQDVFLQADSAPEDQTESMTLETKPSDDQPKTNFPVGPVILGSYGLVMIAVGAGFGWQADQEYEKYNTFENNYYPYATEELADDIETYSTVANVLMFTGLGVAVGSVIWGVVEGVVKKKKRKQEADARLSAKWRPVLAPTQAGVTVDF
jgi:S-formylglutathione hydrolase FrmB